MQAHRFAAATPAAARSAHRAGPTRHAPRNFDSRPAPVSCHTRPVSRPPPAHAPQGLRDFPVLARPGARYLARPAEGKVWLTEGKVWLTEGKVWLTRCLSLRHYGQLCSPRHLPALGASPLASSHALAPMPN